MAAADGAPAGVDGRVTGGAQGFGALVGSASPADSGFQTLIPSSTADYLPLSDSDDSDEEFEVEGGFLDDDAASGAPPLASPERVGELYDFGEEAPPLPSVLLTPSMLAGLDEILEMLCTFSEGDDISQWIDAPGVACLDEFDWPGSHRDLRARIAEMIEAAADGDTTCLSVERWLAANPKTKERMDMVVRTFLGIDDAAVDPFEGKRTQRVAVALAAFVSPAENDDVVVLKTGGGKSLVYQALPLLGDERLCIVVSPLLALMNDQFIGLVRRLDASWVLMLNSEVDTPTKIEVLDQLRRAASPEAAPGALRARYVVCLMLLYVRPVAG